MRSSRLASLGVLSLGLLPAACGSKSSLLLPGETSGISGVGAPAERLQLVSMPGAPLQSALMYEQDEASSYVFQARLTPAEKGAWAAWERVPFDPPFDRRIEMLQIDAVGFPMNGKVIEVATGTVGSPLAITALGTRPVLATTQEGADGSRVLLVQVFAEDGSPVGQAELTAGDGFAMDSNVALLGSPAGDRLLVGWSESSAVNNDDRRVRLARLACVGP